LLFIGGGRAFYDLPQDLWSLDMSLGQGSWSQVQPAGGAPDAAVDACWAWDSDESALIAVGGQGYYELVEDAQQVSFATSAAGIWSLLASGPASRIGCSAAYVPSPAAVYVTGGLTYYDLLADLWSYGP
jgi:hypothetical protein